MQKYDALITAISTLSSGVLGGLIGAFGAVFALRSDRFIVYRYELRYLLSSQLMKIQGKGATNYMDVIQGEYPVILEAYAKVISVTPPWRKSKIRKAWRAYKGNEDNFSPFFIPDVPIVLGVHVSKQPTWVEMIARIKELIGSI